MKIQELIKNPLFKKKFVLEKLLSHYLNKTRTELRTHENEEIPIDILNKIKEDYYAYEKENKPLEYLLGYVDFFGIKFYVNENTLIPRPETEYMINSITEYIQGEEGDKYVLLDIGTGSGVLGCSVLLQNKEKFDTVFLCDISEKALEVAQKNYNVLFGKNTYNSYFLKSDLCLFLKDYKNTIKNRDIILVANLPYIPTKTFEENAPINVQKWEPKVAFIGGDDGLDLYRIMFQQLEELAEGSKTLIMFLEMMTWQLDILKKDFGDKIEFDEVETFHFNIRIVKGVFKKKI